MKIKMKDIEISLDQLFGLFNHDPESLKTLLNDADCYACKSINALVDYRIILTPENGIRLEGKCRFCKERIFKYSGSIFSKLFKSKALILRLESHGIEVLDYLRQRNHEDMVRQLQKDSLKIKARENPVYFQIEVSLTDIKPRIWRRLLILPNTSLKTLHKIIQIAMGWSNYHLHQFEYEGEWYGVPWDEDPDMINDYQGMKINDFLLFTKETCVYEYDFGDGWNHLILLENTIFDHERLVAPVCIDGAGKCPPENCGGPGGFAEIKKIIRKPKHPEYQDTMKWLGGSFNTDEFDLDAVNKELLKRAKFRYPQI